MTSQVLSAIGHLSGLALYTVLSSLEPLLVAALDVEGQSPAERFRWHRRFEAWRYGSGLDYESHEKSKWAVHFSLEYIQYIPTLNQVHSFFEVWRLYRLKSPLLTLCRRSLIFGRTWRCKKPFFKPHNGIDMLENHESAPKLLLLCGLLYCRGGKRHALQGISGLHLAFTTFTTSLLWHVPLRPVGSMDDLYRVLSQRPPDTPLCGPWQFDLSHPHDELTQKYTEFSSRKVRVLRPLPGLFKSASLNCSDSTWPRCVFIHAFQAWRWL